MDRIQGVNNSDDRNPVGKKDNKSGGFSTGGAERVVNPQEKDTRELGASRTRGESASGTELGKRSLDQMAPEGDTDTGHDIKRTKLSENDEAAVPSATKDAMDVESVNYGDRARLEAMPPELLEKIMGMIEKDADLGALSSTSTWLKEIARPEMDRRQFLQAKVEPLRVLLTDNDTHGVFPAVLEKVIRDPELAQHIFSTGSDPSLRNLIMEKFEDSWFNGYYFVQSDGLEFAFIDLLETILTHSVFSENDQPFHDSLERIKGRLDRSSATDRDAARMKDLCTLILGKMELSIALHSNSAETAQHVLDQLRSGDLEARAVAISVAADILRSHALSDYHEPIQYALISLLSEEAPVLREVLLLHLPKLLECPGGDVFLNALLDDGVERLEDMLPTLVSMLAKSVATSDISPEQSRRLHDPLMNALDKLVYHALNSPPGRSTIDLQRILIETVREIALSKNMPEDANRLIAILGRSCTVLTRYNEKYFVNLLADCAVAGVLTPSNQARFLALLKEHPSVNGLDDYFDRRAPIVKMLVSGAMPENRRELMASLREVESIAYVHLKRLAGDAYFDRNIDQKLGSRLSQADIDGCISYILLSRMTEDALLNWAKDGDGDFVATILQSVPVLINTQAPEPGEEREALIGQYLSLAESIVNDQENIYPETVKEVAFQLIVDLPGLS